MRAAYTRTPRRLRGSSSHTSERSHQQRSRKRAKLQLWPAAAVQACICDRFQASLLRHKSKPLKCARHVRAKHRAVCAASAVTHPNDCISNAAASEQSCSSAQQPRCMRAFEIAFSLHIGKPSKCARQIRASIAIICAAPSSSTIAQMLPAPLRVTAKLQLWPAATVHACI